MNEVKRLLYDAIAAGNDSLDVKVDKINGVTIIKAQSVEYSIMVDLIIKALKLIDNYKPEPEPEPEPTPVLIEESVVEAKESDYLKEAFDAGIGLKEFTKRYRREYVNYVLSHTETKAIAAKKLKVQRTYISKILKEINDDTE